MSTPNRNQYRPVHSSARLYTRACVALGCTALLALAWIGEAGAQAWPDRPVRVIVPFTAGGSADVLTRIVCDEMSRLSGQPFVIENKPGAGGTIGTTQAAKAPADGYTLLTVTPSFVITQYAYENLTYDTRKDFTPVGMVLTTPLVLVATPTLNVRTAQGFIDAAKAKPGRVTYSSSGIGSVPHLAGELLKQQAGVDILHVPFGGGAPALTAVVAGQVSGYFGTPIELDSFIKAGKVIAIASTAPARTPSMPDLPTFNESGVKVEVIHFTGLVARSVTPPDVLARMSALVQRALQSKDVRAKIAQNGDVPVGTIDEAAGILRKEDARWERVVKAAHITFN